MQTNLTPITNDAILVAVLVWILRMVYDAIRGEIVAGRNPGAIGALIVSVDQLAKNYVELRTMMIGISGTNGMHFEIHQIRNRIHSIEGDIGVNVGVTQSQAEQLKELRRRVEENEKYIRREEGKQGKV